MLNKSPDAFRTISEVAEELGLPQHVLRFWETRFSAIRPLKRGGGRRYYRPDDVELLRGIQALLYGQGYTIRGVQRIIKQNGVRTVQAIGRGEAPPVLARESADPDADSAPWTEPPEIAETVEAGAPLPPAATERLREALDELLECERILAALRAEREP